MFNSIIPSASAHADDDFYSHHMMGYFDWGIGGIIMMGFFWIFVIAIIVLVIQYIIKNQNQIDRGSNKNALNILEERYAKGEIEKKEFEEKKKDLSE